MALRPKFAMVLLVVMAVGAGCQGSRRPTGLGRPTPATARTEPRTTEPPLAAAPNSGYVAFVPYTISQPTAPLRPAKIIHAPYAKMYGAPPPGQNLPVGPDTEPAYHPGDSPACWVNQPPGPIMQSTGATPYDADPLNYGWGLLPDGEEYEVFAGGVPTQSLYLTPAQKALSGAIVMIFEDNCPFPQFLPEQQFIFGPGPTLGFYDPTNRGGIVLVGVIGGHLLSYRYQTSAGKLLPGTHHFDFYTDTFS